MRSRTSREVAEEANENVLLVSTADSSASPAPVISSVLVEEELSLPPESADLVAFVGIMDFGERGARALES